MHSIFNPKHFIRALIIAVSLAQGALALDKIPQY